MNELQELYDNFLVDLSKMDINNKSPKFVDSISNVIEVNDIISNATLSESNIKYFITKVDAIYTSIMKKKKIDISSSSSFEFFVRVLTSKSDTRKFLNFYDIKEFNVDFATIAIELNENNDPNYNELYNYILLLYVESCNYVYPSIKNEENNIDLTTKQNYERILDSFDNNMFEHDDIGHNLQEICEIITDNLLSNNTQLYSKIKKVLQNPELPTIINDLLKCSLSDVEIEKMNQEFKCIQKDDIKNQLSELHKKMTDMNIIGLLQNFDVSTISSLMSMFKSQIPGNIDIDQQMIDSVLKTMSSINIT